MEVVSGLGAGVEVVELAELTVAVELELAE